MHIVILDSYTLDQGDSSYWEGFRALGNVDVWPRTAPDQVIQRCQSADVILTNKVVIDESIMDALPNLKYIGVLATGMNVIDLDAAAARKIPVTNVPGYSTHAVAQTVFAYLMALYNRVNEHDAAVKSGKWEGDFCFFTHDLQELAGKNIAIIGMGAIGGQVAKIARAFDMNVLNVQLPHRPAKPDSITLEQALPQVDIITLHCPLTDDTHHLVDAAFLAQCKSDAILVNTGRGPLIDEAALIDALDHGKIAHAFGCRGD